MALATAAACGNPPPADGGMDVVVTPDGVGPDATAPDGTAPDGTAPDVPNLPDGATPPRPTVIPVSAMGHDRFLGVTFDAMGNFYATGIVADGTDAMTDFRTIVAKFTPTGALDMTFGMNGVATHNIIAGRNGEVARGIVVQSSGRIVVAATIEHMGATDPRDRDIALVRFNANGTLDTTFGTAGVVTLDLSAGEVVGMNYVADAAWGLTAYPDDRLVVTGAQKRTGGTDSDWVTIRLSADGARDMSFGTNGVVAVDIANRDATPRTSTILPDGSIVTAGYYTDSGVVKPVLYKVTPAGQLDPTFGMNGIYTETVLAAITEAYAVALQGTSFVTAGYGRASATENIDWLSLRINANGTRDMNYGMGGVARLDLNMFNDNARHLVALRDNRILLVGGGRPTEMNADGMIAMLTANGARDTSFGTNGVQTHDLGGSSDFFWGVALSPDGSRAAIVGAKGVGMGPGNDDAAVLLLPVM